MESSSLNPLPYELLETNSGFAFITETGQPYAIYFLDGSVYFLQNSFADNVLTFGFTPLQKGTNPISDYVPLTLNRKQGAVIEHDPRIVATIVDAVNRVLQDGNTILIYVCDHADGRQYARSRLFNLWFRSHANKHIIRREFVNHKEKCSSILYKANNPFRQELEQSLPEAILKIKLNLN